MPRLGQKKAIVSNLFKDSMLIYFFNFAILFFQLLYLIYLKYLLQEDPFFFWGTTSKILEKKLEKIKNVFDSQSNNFLN